MEIVYWNTGIYRMNVSIFPVTNLKYQPKVQHITSLNRGNNMYTWVIPLRRQTT